jgi:hypothetical protein
MIPLHQGFLHARVAVLGDLSLGYASLRNLSLNIPAIGRIKLLSDSKCMFECADRILSM